MYWVIVNRHVVYVHICKGDALKVAKQVKERRPTAHVAVIKKERVS